MSQEQTDKYNIAWFKLHEFVSRGEKERALAIFKLLAHTIDHPAVVLQLEADILNVFSDDAAIDKYYAAARIYQERDELRKAAALYEHLVQLRPENQKFIAAVADLRDKLGN